MITILGKHILGRQIAAAYAHENVPYQHFEDLDHALRAPTRGPLLLWTTQNRSAVLNGFRLRLSGYKVHRYWIGGDVLAIQSMTPLKRRILLALSKVVFQGNTTTSSWLSDELEEFGLKTESMPFGPICCAAHHPLSAAPRGPYTVLHYSTPGCDEIYRPDILMKCAEGNPDVNFICIGNGALRSSGNVKSLGVISTDAVLRLYADCHCLLRVTSHDGFPRMIFEALAHGLDVVTNLRAPHTIFAETADDSVSAVRHLSRAGRTRNVRGREWYFQHHSAAAWARHWAVRFSGKELPVDSSQSK